jgi:hypothetical protein
LRLGERIVGFVIGRRHRTGWWGVTTLSFRDACITITALTMVVALFQMLFPRTVIEISRVWMRAFRMEYDMPSIFYSEVLARLAALIVFVFSCVSLYIAFTELK